MSSENRNKRNFGAWTNKNLWQKLKPAARDMRRNSTRAEDILWQCLRRSNIRNCKFRRQHPVGQFVVDFYCAEARLVIEIDGKIHYARVEEDAERQQYLESLGLRVLRVSNEEVLANVEQVLERIIGYLP